MIRRQSGALLLVVLLLLAALAALSFGLNRAASMDALSLQGEYDRRAAAYLAEAAVAVAKWGNQAAGCTAVPVPQTVFAGGTFAADVKMASSKQLTVLATGTVRGAVRTIERKGAGNEVNMVNFKAPESKDAGGGSLDTTISAATPAVAGNDRTDLALASGQSHALLSWPSKEMAPDKARVLSATLILVQNGTSALARPVGLHRVTTQWDGKATWNAARPGVAWTGGDYAGTPVATVAVGSATTVSWDVTSLVDGWTSGRLANYGMLLRLASPGQAASFYSLDAAAAQRPILRVVFAKSC